MRKFLLSECFRENVQKDAEFEALGILDSRVKLPFLTFIENESYIDKLFHNPHISAVITNVAIYEKYLKDIDCGCYICTNPRLSFFKLHNSLSLQSEYQRPKFETKIGSDCEVSPLAHINKNNVIIGNHVIIEEFVSIKENVIIGKLIPAGTGMKRYRNTVLDTDNNLMGTISFAEDDFDEEEFGGSFEDEADEIDEEMEFEEDMDKDGAYDLDDIDEEYDSEMDSEEEMEEETE